MPNGYTYFKSSDTEIVILETGVIYRLEDHSEYGLGEIIAIEDNGGITRMKGDARETWDYLESRCVNAKPATNYDPRNLKPRTS